MSSQAQLAANQTNAQKSTGPVSAEGKSIVSKNAVKTGLTGRTVLLPDEDAERYARHIEGFREHYSPVGLVEMEIVQRIVDSTWRLGRIPSLEASLYAIGRMKMKDLHKDVDPELRAGLLETEILLAYEKQFRNLQLQESRLRRMLEKDMAELKATQAERQRQTSIRLHKAAAAYSLALKQGTGDRFNPSEFGFEFSIKELKRTLDTMSPGVLANYQSQVNAEAA